MNTPGTTATATVRGVPNVPVMAVADGGVTGWLSAYAVSTFTFHPAEHVTDVVQTFPLQLAACDLDALDGVRGFEIPVEVAEGLEDLRARIVAALTAVKPVEPSTKGAVVVDVDGREWVRVAGPGAVEAWFCADLAALRGWDTFEAIRVLP